MITGGSRGLGLEISKRFRREGASVTIMARDPGALFSASEELRSIEAPGMVRFASVDVADEVCVKTNVERAEEAMRGIDTLVCCAGVYGPIGSLVENDLGDWWDAVRINLLGTVVPCRRVIPLLKGGHGNGKIIILSGGGATKPMPGFSAYAASKAAVVRFAETLAEELKLYGVDVNTVAPGLLNTRLLDEAVAAGPEKAGVTFHSEMVRQKASGSDSMQQAVDLCTFLASKESDGLTGKLISAKWDPWETWAAGSEAALRFLSSSSVLTLRREEMR